jgi:protein-S-isoprenylcysteine O-methyltransferase Ste14
MFSIRQELLATDFGTSYPLLIVGILCLVLAGAMRFAIQKRLTMKVLLGLPEIAPDRYPRALITDRIYARIRHPRYVQMLIVLAGYALIANHLASYIVVALWLAAIQLIVALEEKELLEYFGESYANYCLRVPRFIPKIRSTIRKNHR